MSEAADKGIRFRGFCARFLINEHEVSRSQKELLGDPFMRRTQEGISAVPALRSTPLR